MNSVNDEYESAFAAWFGADSAFAFWKGRVALYAILKGLGVGEGSEIILPGYTCVMDVNPIKYLGATPIYVDIEPKTFNMNVDLLEEKIGEKTKVIIAQHTYGYPCEMNRIMDIAEKSRIAVVEDCCLALGSKYAGKTVGTFGRASYFSFQWNKPYTTGLGGMALVNDRELGEKIKALYVEQSRRPSMQEVLMLAAQLAIYRTFVYPRTTALAQTIFRYLTKRAVVVGSSSGSEFEPVMADDFFKRAGRLQARSGLRQLGKIERNIEHRKQMAQLYDELLRQKGWRGREIDSSVMQPVMVRYPVRITEKNKALMEASKAGIELGSWFECPLHPIETPLEAYDYEIGMCPQAEKACYEVVNLPLHPRVSEKTAKRTVDFITRFTEAS
jgi:dTDP-4-amino-4,6-dideoxygalactose transaminase